MKSSLHIGAIIYPRMDQTDLTGPFEVLSRLPNSKFHIIAKDRFSIRDEKGLILTPEETILQAPKLDLLIVPGGPGQEAMMEDEVILSFIQKQSEKAQYVLSVCTGALVCGAAGLLKGRRWTTHWASFHLLPYFGATPVSERVVVDGKFISTGGVTAGMDGALKVASLLCGVKVAQQIQLSIEYAPQPPFNSGTPQTAPKEIFDAARSAIQELSEARLATAKRIAIKLGI